MVKNLYISYVSHLPQHEATWLRPYSSPQAGLSKAPPPHTSKSQACLYGIDSAPSTRSAFSPPPMSWFGLAGKQSMRQGLSTGRYLGGDQDSGTRPGRSGRKKSGCDGAVGVAAGSTGSSHAHCLQPTLPVSPRVCRGLGRGWEEAKSAVCWRKRESVKRGLRSHRPPSAATVSSA